MPYRKIPDEISLWRNWVSESVAYPDDHDTMLEYLTELEKLVADEDGLHSRSSKHSLAKRGINKLTVRMFGLRVG